MKNNSYNSKFKTKTKKSTAWYISLVIVIMTVIGSILGSIAFFKTCLYNDNSVKMAHADNTSINYTYNGSNLIISCTQSYSQYGVFVESLGTRSQLYSFSIDNVLQRVPLVYFYQNNNYFGNIPVLSFDSLINIDYGKDFFNFNFGFLDNYNNIITNTSGFNSSYLLTAIYNQVGGLVSTPSQINNDTIIEGTYVLVPTGYDPLVETENVFKLTTKTTFGFNCDIVSFRLHTEVTEVNSDLVAFRFKNYLTYFDRNGNTFEIVFHSVVNTRLQNFSPTNIKQYGFEDRVYYIDQEVDDNVYLELVNLRKDLEEMTAERDNLQDEVDNFDITLAQAKLASKQEGFNEGVASANDYTWLGLIGALFDTPISALSGLLNFTILGFNLWSFLTALLTIGLIIFVVRLFI